MAASRTVYHRGGERKREARGDRVRAGLARRTLRRGPQNTSGEWRRRANVMLVFSPTPALGETGFLSETATKPTIGKKNTRESLFPNVRPPSRTRDDVSRRRSATGVARARGRVKSERRVPGECGFDCPSLPAPTPRLREVTKLKTAKHCLLVFSHPCHQNYCSKHMTLTICSLAVSISSPHCCGIT